MSLEDEEDEAYRLRNDLNEWYKDQMITNKHGVKGIYERDGNHFVRHTLNKTTGTWNTERNTSTFVPKVCLDCPFYDAGEYGEYGSKLSFPYCERNVWFPTRKGTCKIKDKELARVKR